MGQANPKPVIDHKPNHHPGAYHVGSRSFARWGRWREAPEGVLRRYVHGPGVDEPLVWYEGAGVADRRWLHADRQGSIIGVSNGAGAVTPYAYGPWGEPSDWTGPRFRYTGQAAFPEAQAYHYKARVYDPAMGRFLQTDPIGQADDPNLYAYVRGDPVNLGDPSGECPPVVCGAIAGAVIGAGLEVASQYLQDGKITNGGAVLREAGIGALAGGVGAGAGALIEKGAKVAQLAAIAGKAGSVVAEGGVAGAVSARVKGENVAQGAAKGAVGGVVTKGVGLGSGTLAARAANAAESRALSRTAGNDTARLLQSGALKMSPNTGARGLPAAVGSAADKATEVAKEACDKFKKC